MAGAGQPFGGKLEPELKRLREQIAGEDVPERLLELAIRLQQAIERNQPHQSLDGAEGDRG